MATLTIVSIWVCNCGTHIKVVALADQTRAAITTARCPKCGVQRNIQADTVVSVTDDGKAAAAARY